MEKRSLWQWLGLAGALSALVYVAHVVLGGILWESYNPMIQTISELTADGAQDAALLRIFTTAYGVLALVFSLCLVIVLRKFRAKGAAVVGAVLLLVMEFSSLVGYGLFPLRGGTEMDPENLGHLIVTGIVVLCTIGSVLLLGLGLVKTPRFKALGVFSIVCAAIIVVSGGMTPVAIANELPVGGLIERVNIFALQTWVLVTSLSVFARKPQRV